MRTSENEQTTSIETVAVPTVEKTEREVQFGNLLSTLNAFKSQLSGMQQQIKLLEKTVNKEFKALQKIANKSKSKGNRKPSGFAKSSKISDSLCSFMNKPHGTEIARTEVTKFIISYIKENSLQQPENKKFIKPDENLRELLGVSQDDVVTYFNLQKYMNQHFIKAGAVATEPVSVEVEAEAQ
jgi:upstream activation factor subunit UAF30